MADEPSMDDILASLDQLLKESESRRDEVKSFLRSSSIATEPKQATEKESKQDHPPTRKTEAPVPRFFMALDHAVSAPSNDAGESETVDTDVGGAQASLGNGESKQRDIASASSSPAKETDTQSAAKRIVLTDSMMVNDVQQSLPLAMGHGSAETDVQEKLPEESRESPVEETEVPAPDSAPVSAIPVRSMPWNEHDIEGLIDQVTDDVCSAMAAQLPELIRKALEDRLSGLIDDRKQNKESDSGTKE